MIVILTENNDQSSSEVIEWLIHSNTEFLRIHETDPITIQHIEIGREVVCFQMEVKNKVIYSKDISSFWFRRGWFTFSKSILFDQQLEKKTVMQINDHLNSENHVLKEFLYCVFTQQRHLGSPLTDKNNKLITLLKAKEFGLSIPTTWITTQFKSLPSGSTDIISKGISSIAYIDCENGAIGNFTEVVSKNERDSDSHFFPSLFQEKLEKQYELRIFFLNDEFFTACIFSQSDAQTSVDFRKYNRKKPNRVVPFQLPEDIAIKLRKLMYTFSHKTASVDMVVTRDNEYVFLEINPVGQFGMVSYPCNYHIEKKIATYLSHESESTYA